jgi:Fe-S-cluster containining protein
LAVVVAREIQRRADYLTWRSRAFQPQRTVLMTEDSWYREGLRFQCTQCGDCCTGDAGYVWVNKEEIAAMAAAMGETDVDRFEQQYVRKVGIRKSLKEYPNGDCVLFDAQQRTCRVYQARPRQCRTWPFWNSNLKSRQAWQTTCQICPGSGRGRLYTLEQIESQRKIIRI